MGALNDENKVQVDDKNNKNIQKIMQLARNEIKLKMMNVKKLKNICYELTA